MKSIRHLSIPTIFYALILIACSTSNKMQSGKVIPTQFHEHVEITRAKGIVLIPCLFEGEVKNYYFDTGAQLSGIQRDRLKGKRVTVRGASNRSIENGTEVLRSFKINSVEFKNTFATNGDFAGLKEQIPNFGGVIGRPIIDRANWLLDLPSNTVTISSEELSDNDFTDIPLMDSSNGAPYTMITLDGKDYKVIIDLGSIAMLNVPRDSELADSLLDTYTFKKESRDRYTVGGLQTITQQVGTIPSIKVGDKEFFDIEVTINESSQLRIGINLFKNNVVYIDNLNKKYRVK